MAPFATGDRRRAPRAAKRPGHRRCTAGRRWRACEQRPAVPDPHEASLRAWASWTERGYHRTVVGPFHPDAPRGSAHRLLNAGLVEAVRRTVRPRVLDAGCGPGNLAAWLGHHRDAAVLEVTGLDADPAALATAAAVAARHRVAFTPACADLCDRRSVDRALGADPFDLVVAVNSLLPAAAPGAEPRAPFHQQLEALAAHTRPGGLLVAVLPGWSRRTERDVDPHGHHLGDNGDGVAHVLHTEATVTVELPAAGWELVDLQPYRYPRHLGGGAPMDWVALARRR